MASNLLQIVIFKILLSTITCNYVYQYPTSQYPQQSYTPYPTSQTYPTPQTYPKQTFPDYKTYANYQPYQAQANFVYPKPESTPPCSTPKPLVPEPILPIVPTPSLKEKPKTPGFDSNVLNNLAIALQLLIVSNIINNPPSESNTGSLLDNFPVMPCKEFENTPFKSIIDAMPDFQHMTPPNSKFLGETDVMSSFGNFGSFPKPRPNGLMSPYEAITSNSFSDRPKYNSMKDFQSPYSAMLAFDNNKDLFSMSDLFQN